MEMNMIRTKMMIICRQPSPVQIMIDQKELENVEYFNNLYSTLTNDARCTREIQYWIAVVKAASTRLFSPANWT